MKTKIVTINITAKHRGWTKEWLKYFPDLVEVVLITKEKDRSRLVDYKHIQNLLKCRPMSRFFYFPHIVVFCQTMLY